MADKTIQIDGSNLSAFSITSDTGSHVISTTYTGLTCMKIYSDTTDKQSTVRLYSSTLGLTSFNYIMASVRMDVGTTDGTFPSLKLYFEDGSFFTYYYHNVFPWSGYTETENIYKYQNNGYVFAWGTNLAPVRAGTTPTLNTWYAIEIIRNLSAKTITVNTKNGAGTVLKSCTTPALSYGDKKITAVEFGLNTNWYNNTKQGYMDWVQVSGTAINTLNMNIDGAIRNYSDGWVNIGGVLRNIEGIWSNIDGVLREV